MTMQTFRAPHMQAALEAIQTELGSDALVVSVREISEGPAWQVWRKPGVEVVALANTPSKEPRPPQFPHISRTQETSQEQEPSPQDDVQALLQALAKRVEAHQAEVPMESALPAPQRPELPAPRPGADSLEEESHPKMDDPALALIDVGRILVSQGLDSVLVKKVIAQCAAALSPASQQNEKRVRRHIQAQLEAELQILTPARFTQGNAICLIGISGAGKTSALAKLAVHFSGTPRKKVLWVCADTVRAGAIAESRALAESLGISLRPAYTPEELAEIVAAADDFDLVLVDTPSCNPRREAEIIELGALLNALPGCAAYLVLPATAKDADLRRAVSAFSPFALRGLLVTKLDETETFGPVVNAAWRSALPLTFFTSGPQVLDDLQSAQSGHLIELLFEA